MTVLLKSLHTATVACAGLLASAASAQTVRVDYSVPSLNATVEMDNGLDFPVTFDPNTTFVDLTPGVVEENVILSGGQADVVQPTDAAGNEPLRRFLTVSIAGGTPVAREVDQTIFINTSSNPPFGPGTADILITSGAPLVYDLGAYELTVTPRSFVLNGQTSTEITLNNSADFLLEVVPEPASGLLVLGGAGLLLSRRQRRA